MRRLSRVLSMQALVSSFIRSLSRSAEIVIVVMIFAGWFIYASLQAVLAGFPAPQFDDSGLWWLIVFEVITFAIAWAFLRVRGWRLEHFNLRLSWISLIAGVLLFGLSLLINAALWDLFAKHRYCALQERARRYSCTQRARDRSRPVPGTDW